MAIALVNDPTLVPLMGPLDIDAYINPRATTVSSILRHIRHGRVRGDLFHRRCRGRGDRGAGAVDLARWPGGWCATSSFPKACWSAR